MRLRFARWTRTLALFGTFGPLTASPLPAAEPPGPRPIEIHAVNSEALKARPLTPDATADDEEANETEIEGRKVETIRERYRNGAIRTERQVAQDADGNYMNHGLWRSWDPQGNLLVRGHFRGGMRHGKWERLYHANEAPLFSQPPYRDFTAPYISDVVFDEGQIHGKWTISDARGRKISEIDIDQGERHGKAIWWHSNGAKMQEIDYADGLLDGQLVQWNTRGDEVVRKTFQNGREVVVRVESYKNGKPKSEVTILSPTLAVASRDDWWNAQLASYRPDGGPVKNGLVTLWHSSGERFTQGAFENGQPVGIHSWWYANGQKAAEGEYKAGKLHGSWTWWYENGQKSSQGEYDDGLPVGQWSWWKPDGKVSQRAAVNTIETPKELEGVELTPPLPRPGATPELSRRLLPDDESPAALESPQPGAAPKSIRGPRATPSMEGPSPLPPPRVATRPAPARSSPARSEPTAVREFAPPAELKQLDTATAENETLDAATFDTRTERGTETNAKPESEQKSGSASEPVAELNGPDGAIVRSAPAESTAPVNPTVKSAAKPKTVRR